MTYTVHVTDASSFRPCFVVKVRLNGKEVWRCAYNSRTIAQEAGESVVATMSAEASK